MSSCCSSFFSSAACSDLMRRIGKPFLPPGPLVLCVAEAAIKPAHCAEQSLCSNVILPFSSPSCSPPKRSSSGTTANKALKTLDPYKICQAPPCEPESNTCTWSPVTSTLALRRATSSSDIRHMTPTSLRHLRAPRAGTALARWEWKETRQRQLQRKLPAYRAVSPHQSPHRHLLDCDQVVIKLWKT